MSASFRSATVASLLLAGLWMALPSQAAANALPANVLNGVQCPSGYSHVLASNNTHVTCQRGTREERASVCSPITVQSRTGRIGANENVRRVTVRNAPDRCTSLDGQTNGGAPQAVLLPGDLRTGWSREERANGEDIFVRTGRMEYAFPAGAVFNPSHDPAKGVRCPSGFSGRALNRGLICERIAETKPAHCDFGWSISVDHNNGRRDQCLGLNVGQTVPNGVPNALLQTQRAYWQLDVRAGRDQWIKRDYIYESRR